MGTPAEENSEETRKARTEMRERFLRLMTTLTGQPCEFTMCEKTFVKGELRGCDRDVLNLAVANLETPMGKVPQAILRTDDIISVKFPNFSLHNSQ